jgi:hypothetical protein
VVLKNGMKVQQKKRGDWNGKSESDFSTVMGNLEGPLYLSMGVSMSRHREMVHPTNSMSRTRMMKERPFRRTRISK